MTKKQMKKARAHRKLRKELDLAYRRAAKQFYQSDGEIEIDDNAVVSLSEEKGVYEGAYVAAWVWVYYEDCSRLNEGILPLSLGGTGCLKKPLDKSVPGVV